ncbi:TetR/AcrR family transcriptional regulator [Sinirhodobacter populi]|uniref:TetR/AcrR family transcriptional regulator n=1 Tax=Paenirhodobacter populi TaxID=2306993 RepID=A0A443K3T5_9RHOB|nr:TetR/AcrR family transcriptional regulator [Sinirhodobacter populi]RWR27426.1 TetR/AcrR family transcriptional regulator [Sinirhodobacter populi]
MTHDGSDTPNRRPGRPRSASSRAAVLGAAHEVLAEAGLAGFNIDAVATRAGVARTTIYRWWPNKGRLAIESFLEKAKAQADFGDNLSPRESFERLVLSAARLMSGPSGMIVVSILLEAQKDPDTLSVFNETYHFELRERSKRLLQRGISSGVFRSDLDMEAVLDAAIGAIYLRVLLGHEIDEPWARALASNLIEGMVPDHFSSRQHLQ